VFNVDCFFCSLNNS